MGEPLKQRGSVLVHVNLRNVHSRLIRSLLQCRSDGQNSFMFDVCSLSAAGFPLKAVRLSLQIEECSCWASGNAGQCPHFRGQDALPKGTTAAAQMDQWGVK
ncbi:hypothetical protein WMY93_029392 [Mugilogobius chulae]|uniref:Uncharacterized protein n=1 Tax=Mugilogobius chulae TaxID=88201 RepID=A0AAW0N3B6_9GOBI